MSRRHVPRLAAALALAAVLATTLPLAAVGPPGAVGARRGSESWIEAVWGWVGKTWEGAAALWAPGRATARSAPSTQCDGTVTIDPNGCPARPQGDGGITIDPNG